MLLAGDSLRSWPGIPSAWNGWSIGHYADGRSKYTGVEKSNPPLKRRTLAPACKQLQREMDLPGATMSHHMINIYLRLPVHWKKDNLLLMHLRYYSYLSPREIVACVFVCVDGGGSCFPCWMCCLASNTTLQANKRGSGVSDRRVWKWLCINMVKKKIWSLLHLGSVIPAPGLWCFPKAALIFDEWCNSWSRTH